MQTANNNALIVGTFINEVKNRFICLVNVNGEETVCYIPSSCRLSNFLHLEGRQVLLSPIKSKKARTKYSVFAVKINQKYIPINFTIANQAIEEQLNRRIFSFLGRRDNVMREVMLNGYKADLLINDTNTLIEIKSILSFSNKTFFPTIYSSRAIEQLKKIKKLLLLGYSVCYILVSLNTKVKQVILNKDMTEFYKNFIECMDLGMSCYGYSIYLNNDSPKIYTRVSVIIN